MPLVAPETVIQLVYSAVGALLVLTGLPLYFRKIPPNRFYGFRTGRTLSKPDVWYAVNRVTGGWLVLTGAATTSTATAADWFGLSNSAAASINCAVFIFGIAATLIHSVHTLWRKK